ncbi:MAG: hypothetical protein B6241_02605 [Spirochaetaceae bacterium 4572_59]|nr:MAG: hypothetical protein B6241_02605 [Spirochaetaceae bacterium 4572_59]
MTNIKSLKEELDILSLNRKISPVKKLKHNMDLAVKVLRNENPIIRPYDRNDKPGGLLVLDSEIPVVLVPDLHARRNFLREVINWLTPNGETVLERLMDHSLQLLCLGDGFHAEKREYFRWVSSFEEFQNNYKRHKNMDLEMSESFGLMEMIMILKREFADHFHFLKGNHENIRNEEGAGNHPFGKFVYEGEMVKQWVLRFQGQEFLDAYAEFEYLFPYMAVGNNFMASHAEPLEYYFSDEVINIDGDDELKLGLTWTRNDQAKTGSVQKFLKEYGKEFNRTLDYYIGGHRTISTRYNLRAQGKYVQIHNPDRMQIFYSNPEKSADPETDVIDIEKKGAAKDGPYTN